ncbi:uncharacterized protein K02A2.6-like [Ochlerotatus camptorhynchus]|uniref:uncharacterized protein K02A2.6-like n=1 Tax=Ochlerotatus camptorhynchus TaxID=644619 RepID=UPI0031D00490
MVSLDVFFAEYKGLKWKFLVTVDHYPDFFEVNLLKDLTPETVIAVCKENFARHGIPQLLLSDNGTNFVNRKMIQFATEWCFEQVTSAPHHQQANGKSEAAVKIAKRLLKKAEESKSEFWYAFLHWRNIPNKIGSSPVARLFSRSTRCGIPAGISHLLPKIVEDVPSSIEEQRKRTKLHYDKKVRNLPVLDIGSPVYVQLDPASSKLWTPGTVSNRLNERSYLVDVDGNQYRRSLVHLKPRKELTMQPHRSSPSSPVESMAGENRNADQQTINDSTCQNSQSIAAATPPTMTESQNTLSSSSPRDLQANGMPNQVERPRRKTRLPERLKDYQLEL